MGSVRHCPVRRFGSKSGARDRAAQAGAIIRLCARRGTDPERDEKFESGSLQQTVPSLSGFRLRFRKSPGFRPVWGPCRAAVSAETRTAPQHRAAEWECLCRAIFQYRRAAGCGSRYSGAGRERGRLPISASLNSDQLTQNRVRSAARARPAVDVSAPATCLQSDRAAGVHREWLA